VRRFPSDTKLAVRMFVTMFLLAALYLLFMVVLWRAGAGFVTIVVFVALMLGAQYYLSDQLVLWSMGAKPVTPQQQPELHSLVERLAALADLPKPKVAVVDTRLPNAFATGRSPEKAVVAVTSGLLDRLEPPELEAVLAHEISHVKNRDMTVLTLASFFATVASFIVQHFFYWGGAFGGGGRREQKNSAALVWIVSILVWIISYFLIRALSRYREFAADRGAAVLTGAPGNLASALVKISSSLKRIPTKDLRQAEAFNAFFIVPALNGQSIQELFSTDRNSTRLNSSHT
jgi:heat shock protein HtpX